MKPKSLKQLEAVKLREGGNTFKQIGDAIGTSASRARQLYHTGLLNKERLEAAVRVFGSDAEEFFRLGHTSTSSVVWDITRLGLTNKDQVIKALKEGKITGIGRVARQRLSKFLGVSIPIDNQHRCPCCGAKIKGGLNEKQR